MILQVGSPTWHPSLQVGNRSTDYDIFATIGDPNKQTSWWLVFSHPFEKYAQVKMGSSSPKFGVNIPKIFELPPPSKPSFATSQHPERGGTTQDKSTFLTETWNLMAIRL